MRERWTTTPEHEFVSRVLPVRVRNNRATCETLRTPTGVDLLTGRVLVEACDADLRGLPPLAFRRIYASSWSHRAGTLGYGWHHAFEQSVWIESGRAVYRDADGREIEFDTFPLPGHVIKPGDDVRDPRAEFALRCRKDGEWRVETRDRTQLTFRPIAGDAHAGVARLIAVRTQSGNELEIKYDKHARIASVHQAGGRGLEFEYDAHDRLVTLLRDESGRGWAATRHYQYSPEGDLVAVLAPGGAATRYQYVGHVLVQRTDGAEHSMYYGFDGIGSDARCIETWADPKVYHHRLDFDVRLESVSCTDALGHKRKLGTNVVHAIRRTGATRFEHDRTMRTVAAVGLKKRTLALGLDPEGRIVRIDAPAKISVAFAYDPYGNVERVMDARGQVWSWRHDANGYVVEETSPLGERWSYEWGGGLLRAISGPTRGRSSIYYDLQQPILVERFDGSKQQFEYDADGRLSQTTDGRGFVTRFEYDANGSIVRAATSDGFDTVFERDAMGRLVARQKYGVRTEWRYFRVGWVKARTESDGREIALQYDVTGRLLGIRNEANEFAWLHRNREGALIRDEWFDGTSRRYAYYPSGEVRSITLPGKRKLTYEYDDAARVVRVKGSDRRDERIAWDPAGAIESIRAGDTEVRFDRDAAGRIVRESQNAFWVESTYDPSGARSEVRSSLGARIVIVRDTLGRPTTVCYGDPTTSPWRAELTYDGEGAEITRSFPAGVRSEWERDPAGRPLRHRVSVADALAFERAYAWRPDGGPAGVRDSRFGITYVRHDAAGRVIGWQYDNATPEARELDEIGNVFRSRDRRDAAYEGGGRIAWNGDVRYRHDARGYVTAATSSDGRTWRYEWSDSGLLLRVELPEGGDVRYAYDGFGRRVTKSYAGEEVRWIWDGNHLLHELSSAEGLTTWIWCPSSFSLLGKVKNNRFFSVVTDQVDAPLAFVDGRGRLMWSGEISAFGEVRRDVSNTRCPWRLAGYYQDDETLLLVSRYRYYSPVLGRFISPQPLGLHGGTNAYRMVDDPMWQCDPWGLAGAGDRAGITGDVHALVPYATLPLHRVRGDLAGSLMRLDDVDPRGMVRRAIGTYPRTLPTDFDPGGRPEGWQVPRGGLFPTVPPRR